MLVNTCVASVRVRLTIHLNTNVHTASAIPVHTLQDHCSPLRLHHQPIPPLQTETRTSGEFVLRCMSVGCSPSSVRYSCVTRAGGGGWRGLLQSRGGGGELQCGVRILETGIRAEINAQWVVRERLKTCHWKKRKKKGGFGAVCLWFQESSYSLSLGGDDDDNKSVY
jgi:hypothetical protein